jgi:hypothetical protein
MPTVFIPSYGDKRFTSWAKLIKEVKPDAQNGYGFVGDWLKFDRRYDLKEGAVVLTYAEDGSRAHRRVDVRLYQVRDGELQLAAQSHNRDWAFDIRDVARLLLETQSAPESGLPEELVNGIRMLVDRFGLDQVKAALEAVSR